MDSIAIIGAGRIGQFIGTVLSKDYKVSLIDASTSQFNEIDLPTIQCDATRYGQLENTLNSDDLVVSAVPGHIGHRVLENVIKSGHSIVDISFAAENSLSLDLRAREQEVTAIVDAGVAPGLSNFVGGHYDENHQLYSYHCYVGGLPVKRSLPWEYKAPFSPEDVIEEYTRPARLRKDGERVQKPALTDYNRIETTPLGTLEAFNTDGLRTLLDTLEAPNLKEQTLRYPGHCHKIKLLKDAGFLSNSPIDIREQSIRPRELTADLLKKQWKMKSGDQDCTYMRIDLELSTERRRFELFDQYDTEREHTSMARCTGYSCIQFVHWIMDGTINRAGIIPPEQIAAKSQLYDQMITFLRDKGINLTDQKVK